MQISVHFLHFERRKSRNRTRRSEPRQTPPAPRSLARPLPRALLRRASCRTLSRPARTGRPTGQTDSNLGAVIFLRRDSAPSESAALSLSLLSSALPLSRSLSSLPPSRLELLIESRKAQEKERVREKAQLVALSSRRCLSSRLELLKNLLVSSVCTSYDVAK